MRDTGRQMQDYARRQAQAARDRARIAAAKRKEEYLGARVPRELRDKVIARARDEGIPVSILIRHILEDAFGETRKDESGGAAKKTDRYAGVLGWKDIVLHRDMPCSACGRVLESGSRVMLGLGIAGEDHVILCQQCRKSV